MDFKLRSLLIFIDLCRGSLSILSIFLGTKKYELRSLLGDRGGDIVLEAMTTRVSTM